MNLRQPKIRNTIKTNNKELEKLAKLQNVKPFNFEEANGEGAELWTNDEFNEFENWLQDVRISDTIRENSK